MVIICDNHDSDLMNSYDMCLLSFQDFIWVCPKMAEKIKKQIAMLRWIVMNHWRLGCPILRQTHFKKIYPKT